MSLGVWLGFIKSRSMNISLVLNFQLSRIHTLVPLSDPVLFPEVSATSLLSRRPPECTELSLTRCKSQGILVDGECAAQSLHVQNRLLVSTRAND